MRLSDYSDDEILDEWARRKARMYDRMTRQKADEILEVIKMEQQLAEIKELPEHER